MPRAQLFEVDGINPPRRISKLSLRYRRSIAALKKDNMPPRRLPSGGRATVNQNHPASTAAAAAAARVVAVGKINGGKLSAPASGGGLKTYVQSQATIDEPQQKCIEL